MAGVFPDGTSRVSNFFKTDTLRPPRWHTDNLPARPRHALTQHFVSRIHPAQRAITLELFDKAEVLAYYDLAVRSARQSHQLPAVLKVNVFLSQAKAGRITATRRNILIRDRYTCQYCTAAGESVDHVLPLSRGGDWSWTNLVCACNRCNAKKGARTPAEANMPLRRMPKEPNGRSALYSRLGYATLVDSPPAEWEGYI